MRGVDKLKAKLEKEKESHATSRSNMVMLLAKANKWEGKAISKDEKFTWVANKLNECLR